ncbi:MAG: phosphatase PAP2 family protein [Endomicrobia bacterium]|nr:phosphatase PAP2 family protein [Endomicrobiia bacterium]
MLEFLKLLDINLFYFINHGIKNDFFDFLMPFVTDVRNFYIVFLILWLLMVFSSKYKVRVAGWTIIVAVTLSDILSSKILKHIFLRQRPYEVLSDVYKLVSSGGPSFPSSHAVNSFTAATLIMLFFRNPFYTIIAYVVAFMSAFSRIYVGVHYPSDVIFGAILGIILGYLIFKIVCKLFHLEGKKETENLTVN